MDAALTLLICTHNRADLLERTLASINAAKRPAMPVQILVAANACTDDTAARLRAYQAQQGDKGLPLRLLEVPIPGKSHALNRAIPEIDTELTAFVDDDHRVDEHYLVAIEQAAQTWPDAGLYCGRILPDWDGTESAWVHDEGPYRIYPLPVPRYDQGSEPKVITAEEGPIPGGGNLVVRRQVFELAGQFSTELGPHGHDLGGGEDSEYVLRALSRGARCQYVPDMVQHHYVDTERLRLGYLLKKSFQRTRSTSRIQGYGRVPLYMWRKLAEYGFHSVFSLSWAERRFYWVRTAAALGEVQGRHESGHRGRGLDLPPDPGMLGIETLALLTAASGLVAWFASGADRWTGLLPALAVAAAGTAALLAKSLSDFSQTGPRIREEILTHYRRYTLLALARLSLWAFAIMLFLGGGGVLVYYALRVSLGWSGSVWMAALAAAGGILAGFSLQFVRFLRFNPGLLIASMHYRTSRLYPLWQWATPKRIHLMQWALGLAAVTLIISTSRQFIKQNQAGELIALWAAELFYAGMIAWAAWLPESRPTPRRAERDQALPPNILMIGSDTLRADRLSALGYRRALTPNIDALAAKGALFANCYVPCARTAPSLVSLLTGTWPHTHGIRDNFVTDAETRLKVDALPQLLKPLGYRTAALSDWCGGDMGKLSFGFDYTDLPEDQWNLKYLIRQGPKDLRLFISLFTHNRLGRLLLPELYYLGGVPLTSQMGCRARRLVSRLAASPAPFFLNVFYSTTHPPFASEWPWYTSFSNPDYDGESKFAMAKLTDPFDIIRRQGAPKEEFDLDQIIDLYDGCVAEFDDEVGKMLRHLEVCGLESNTIIVVYSDHGMEFFEHDTWGQGNSAVGDFSPRIPLLIRDPRQPACGTVNQVVRSIDLAPTLLELVGAAPASGMDGVSLTACISQQERCPQLDAFNETGIWIADIPGLPDKHLRYPDMLELMEVPDRESGTLAIKPHYLEAVLRAKDRMIRHDRWKLVYQPLESGHLLRLFDLDTDPICQRNVLDLHPEVADRLQKALMKWIGQDHAIGSFCSPGTVVENWVMPRVSVILPTHNRPGLLAEALASLSEQTLADWEAVIVDDASTPPVSLNNPRLRIIRHDVSQGGAAAKNTGICHASGEVLAFLDDDDLYAPQYLERALEVLDHHPEIDVVFMGVSWFGTAATRGQRNYDAAMTKCLAEASGEGITKELIVFDDKLVNALLNSVPMAFQRPVVRAEALARIGEYRPDCLLWDCDWAIRAALNSRTALITEGLYLQRAEGQGFSSKPDRILEHMNSAIEIKDHLLHLATGDPSAKFAPLFRRAAAEAWFDLAWYHFQHGNRSQAMSAMFRSMLRQLMPYQLKLLARLALPTNARQASTDND